MIFDISQTGAAKVRSHVSNVEFSWLPWCLIPTPRQSYICNIVIFNNTRKLSQPSSRDIVSSKRRSGNTAISESCPVWTLWLLPYDPEALKIEIKSMTAKSFPLVQKMLVKRDRLMYSRCQFFEFRNKGMSSWLIYLGVVEKTAEGHAFLGVTSLLQILVRGWTGSQVLKRVPEGFYIPIFSAKSPDESSSCR